MALTDGGTSSTSSLGQFNTDPNGPLDASQIISGVTDQAYKNWGNQQEMMDWAKKQFAKNEGTADTVSKRALDTSSRFGDYAARDQAEYETYQPARKAQLDFAMDYTTPGRMAANRAGAGAQSQIATQATRDASERALQGIGVDPSSGRFAGLQAGLDAAAAARSAAAMTKSDRDTEAMGQEYLDRAIKTGAVLPGQAVNEAGVGIAAGNQAVNAPLAATASGAATMGTPLQWNQQGNEMFKQWLPAAVAQQSAGEQMNRDVFSSNMDMMKFNQQKEKESSSGAGAAIGAGMGILGTVAGSYFGGPIGGSLGGKLGSSLGGALSQGASEGGSSGFLGARGGMVRRFADGGSVDDDDLRTHDDYPARRNPDGTRSTEVSVTLDNPRLNRGQWTNVPSLWEGREIDDEDEIVDRVHKAGRYYPSYDTVDDAEAAAHARSDAGGAGQIDRGYSTYNARDAVTGSYEEGGSVTDMINSFANGGDIYPPGMDDEEMEGPQPPEEEAAEGDAPGMVPPEASPSGGAETDDVHAMVSEGEFVMPKDVTSWFGEKFMQNLIKKARDEMAGPKAEGQPGPPMQAMALSPPTFRSEGARAGA